MLYPVLVLIFLCSLVLLPASLLAISATSSLRARWRRRLGSAAAVWYSGYLAFIVLGTGPSDRSIYPSAADSPYRLPWQPQVRRWVAQGNRSFTSHRGSHLFAWDFYMPIGTPVLAARTGRVVEVDDHLDGIGWKANLVMVEHDDGTRAGYAHLQKGSAVVEMGDEVHRGQMLARSGMVGQTLFPHLHFFVLEAQGEASIPISFGEVAGGVPLAGHFYTSDNRPEDGGPP